MALAVGTKAPDFKLFNSDKKEVSLSDFSGKNHRNASLAAFVTPHGATKIRVRLNSGAKM